ncbi:MAG: hypothetical protein WB621_12195, partial [Candidatus Acidiferrales bacterium]
MNRRAFLKNLSGVAGLATLGPSHFSRIATNLAPANAQPPQQQTAQPAFNLVDVTTSAGIHFHHNSGAYGGKLLPETLGSGCAFLDYDNDGWQDILLI